KPIREATGWKPPLARSIRALVEAGRSPPHPLSRSAPHGRDVATGAWHPSEDRLRDVGPHHCGYHARSVLPCHTDDAARSGTCNGRHPAYVADSTLQRGTGLERERGSKMTISRRGR